MKTEFVPIQALHPAGYNPRKVSQDAFENMQRSLDEFGMPQSIVANKRNNVIVGGHLRYQAAKALGWEEVPVTWVDLEPAKERALNVALNSPKLQGEFDTDQLAELLHELDDDLQILTGYSDEDLASLQDGFVNHEELEAESEKPKVAKFSTQQLKDLANSYHDIGARGHIIHFLDWIDNGQL